MEPISFLLFLTFSMFLGSYVSGTIPMVFSMSEAKIRLLTILGSGILVGTSLSVIIPEGVNAIYSQAMKEQIKVIKARAASPLPSVPSPHDEDNGEGYVPHSMVGVTLVAGFIFMLIVDQCVSKHTSPSVPQYTSIASLESGATASTSSTMSHRHRKGNKNFTATIGLIVHSAADGIALGAAASTSHTDVEMIVFLAIMLHKAPASFGLVTFLLHEGLDRNRIKRHLLAFSLSAPIGTFVTYFGLGAAVTDSMADYNATGIAMLFSAGTFLFVATVHVLPEITQQQELRFIELLVLIGGAICPLFLSVNHHH